MSGAGRKSCYRRRVMNDYLGDCPEPQNGQSVVEAKGSRGGNIIEVALPGKSEVELALLPTRFKKENGESEMGNIKGICHRVEHVLSKDHVKQLKHQGLFPKELNKDVTTLDPSQRQGDLKAAAHIHEELENHFTNPNRRVPLKYYCSDEEDTSEDDEEDEMSLVQENDE